MRAALLGAALLGGCFNPQFPTNLACGTGPNPCPPGQVCHQATGTCVVELPAPMTDGSILLDDAGNPVLDDAGNPIFIDAAPGTIDAMADVDAAAACQITPSNGVLDTDLDGVATNLHVIDNQVLTFNTETGQITSSGAVAMILRPPGEGVLAGVSFIVRGGLGTFGLAGLVVDDGGEVRASGDFPLLVVSTGDVVIAGRIDLSAGSDGAPGSGGGRGGYSGSSEGAGCGGGDSGSLYQGAGGAGFATPGGGGGGGGGAGAGPACGAPALVPLIGGSGGGRGTASGSEGGGGGGAVQISSCTSVLVQGVIDVAGGGGDRGNICDMTAMDCRGSAGGGSGGAILLEAPMVTVTASAFLSAPGGGGGGGGGFTDDAGAYSFGNNGTSASPGGLPNGGTGTNGGGRGGNGGYLTIGPDNGITGTDTGGFGVGGDGGGGGSVGRIRVNAITYTGDPGASISPPQTNGVLIQR